MLLLSPHEKLTAAIRIDSHEERVRRCSSEVFIQLALSLDDLEAMNLRVCGTLVLEACETGMAKHVGATSAPGRLINF